ncbi:MAG: LLM class flavin-dependent oxidoreductase [Cyanobacteria bacterium SZAS LIN-2]|nr:LLM class flavin-dependent oxidoreductase [Cyanobacteria bacterium SZAS LIN-3]MBS1997505.1 LLM class flavin-dependent oxidoreductase [Cyanobacteria bacterium SZAS LIN-2]
MKALNETPLSILDLAPVAAGQTAAEAFARTLDLAQHAESWGYNRFWLAEHHNMQGIASAATSILIGMVAGGTKTIRVGSGGVMLPNHAPLIIAEQFGTLESLYPGRIDLGLGRAPGTDPATARALRRGLTSTGQDFPRLLHELRSYFDDTPSEDGVKAYPGNGLNVPIWLLGSSDFSAQLAAALGLPFAFASHFAPEELYRSIKVYRQDFRPSKHLKKPYVMIGVPVVAADTDDEARFQATTPLQRVLKRVRGQSMELQPPIEPAEMETLWTFHERAAVYERFAIAIVGGAQTVQKKLNDLLESTQADEFMIVSDLYDAADRLKSFEITMQAISRPCCGSILPR